jgi:lipoyl synthase
MNDKYKLLPPMADELNPGTGAVFSSRLAPSMSATDQTIKRTTMLRLPQLRSFSSSAISATTSSARLQSFRERLAIDDSTIDEFASPTPPRSSAPNDVVLTKTAYDNKKAPPRSDKILPKPKWLKVAPANSENHQKLRSTVRELGLATVCEEAKCPNIGDCWGGGKDHTATATIMIMGDTCTRGCRFCSVKTSRAPPPLDPNEPAKVSDAIARWGLDYVVLTSVDRDDLPDQGSQHFRQVIQMLKQKKPDLLVEALTPDFQGNKALVEALATSGLDVFAHNMETVERLTPHVRDRRAKYRQSLEVLEHVKSLSYESSIAPLTKTSLMLGLSETDDEVRQTLHDLRAIDVDVVTFGQYLQPTRRHLPVQEYVPPEKFAAWQTDAEAMGFKYVASGPLVRSSYKAGEFFLQNYLKEQKAQQAEIA